MTREISNIVSDLVNEIDSTIVGQWNATESRTDVCSTKWGRIGKTITNASDESFLIQDLEPDEWIMTEPIGADGVLTLAKPFFITGTRIATNSEWTKATPNLLNKTPLIWLLEVINYRAFGRESTMEFESDLRLFFLDETNVAQFYTSDHREQVVQPMESLAREFIDTIGRNRNFKTIEEFEMITFSRFGVERENGMFQNILDANLSGVELRLTLEKFKENCKC